MELKAIYEEGQLIFDKPIKFRRVSIPVIVIVSDGDVESQAEPRLQMDSLESIESLELRHQVERLRAIRGALHPCLSDGWADHDYFLEEIEVYKK